VGLLSSTFGRLLPNLVGSRLLVEMDVVSPMEECGSAFKSGVGGMEEDSGETEPEEDDRFGLCIYSNISDSFSKITV
jgi:hypothetical protein